MQVAISPYLTSGVALVGASVIAVTPIAVSSPDVNLPATKVSTADVKLTAAVDPIAAYVALISNTLANVAAQAGDFLSNPTPILSQVLINQLNNGSAAAGALANFGSEFLTNVITQVPLEFQEAIGNIAAGNVVAAGQNLVDAIVQPALIPALSLLPALGAALQAPVQNLAAVSEQFVTIAALGGLGALSPLVSTVNANAQAIQNVIDAVSSGDPIGAAGAIASAPAIVLDGIINGFGFDGGLINPGLSLVSALRNILTTIATAITPAATATTQALREVASPTSKAAATVTLDVGPTAGARQVAAAETQTVTAKKSAAATSGDEGADRDATAISVGAAKDADTSKDAGTAKDADTSKDAGTAEDADASKDAAAAKDADGSKDADAKADAKSGDSQ